MSDEIKIETPEVKPPQPPSTPVITPKEKEDFFKAMLADKPYTQLQGLFNGKLSVKFKTLTMAENNDILKQISLDQEKGIAKNDDSYFSRIAQYRLGISIDSIDNSSFQPSVNVGQFPFDQETGESYLTERIKLFQEWQVPKLAGVLSAFSAFEKKVMHMTNQMDDASFWKAGA